MHYSLALQELVDEDEEPYGYYTLDIVDEDDLEWPWLQGAPLPDGGPQRPITLAVDPDEDEAGAFADWISGPIPLISARLRTVLEACSASNLECFDVAIRGADDFIDPPVYFAVNVVGVIAVAGPGTLSSKTFGVTGADVIQRLVVSDRVNDDLLIFRMAEHVSTVVVAERVRQACEAAGIDTLQFVPLDQFTT